MKRYFILFTITLLVPFFIHAQDLADALRFSQIQTQGTARAGAMGNAFGALGGDFTSISINPAGIGLYRSGEFTVTPKSSSTKTTSSYWGSTGEDTDYKFILNNISYVSVIPTKTRSEAGIISVNMGIGYNRLKDFNSNAYVGANSVESSFLDKLVENANGEDPNQGWSDYYEELASEVDLIYVEEGEDLWRSDIQINPYDETVNNHKHLQRKSISRSGSIDEYSLTIGLNFNHKLYMGASWGITDVYYRESSQIFEQDTQDNIPFFNQFSHNSYLVTNGYGNNFKFGIIYKPIHEVRLGISIHTPTFYRLHDFFNTSMQSSITYDDGTENYDEFSPTNNYDYRLETPFRTTFSGAFLLAKKGLISIDYELLNYGNAKLRNGGDGYNFNEENMDISEAYKTSGNLRIGGEYMVTKAFSLRGGYELQQSAYNSSSFGASQPNSDANLMVYSGGLGYRMGSFFADIAYRYSVIDDYDLPYPSPISGYYPVPELIEFTTVKHDVLFTFGFKF